LARITGAVVGDVRQEAGWAAIIAPRRAALHWHPDLPV